ncbi:acyl-CoA dehydrogenase [Sphingomonas sp. AR_OL41]|uniref:acyl-CoA dehydrogenase n=1 Tax=Sphingomonas sp. AR_OL41 TaxID=3042729 RepID=UPI0024810F8D|nr:acyl-CoA dehydrogenase [Sphingomonas sp. AR_OL41]MDH7973233.1 acyl-CoA dehydrogenase [Sphingomonas sp. AR_OL41]
MTHPLIVRRDLDFLLHDWLRIDTLYGKPGFAELDRELVDGVLDLSAKLAVERFLPHYKASDETEPRLGPDGVHILPAIGEALAHYAELGLFAAGFAPELGGLGLPYLLCSASFAYFAAANIATAAYPMLTTANARLIVTFGTAAQIDAFARPQIAGQWFGTMCLSEPQAGSSLADVATRAVADGTDQLGERYRLSGNKMWISGGDQDASANIVHLVLAKVANADGSLPEGTAGLSLFIVPKILADGARNDVTVAGLNHKMGYRGTANCLLNFGEAGGATGWIVGAPGEGLRQMFLMMNEARIGVGLGAAALGYRGYRHAVSYARERLQGRSIGQRGGAPVAIIEHPDVKRMLLAQKAYAEGALALCLYCAKLVDEHDDPDSTALLALLTPVAKTWPSEYGLAANDLAIQVHGGYGYTRDFDVEQLYRDNRLNPIHEGTTGIQAIDLLGRKILRDDGRGMTVLRARIADTARRATELPEWSNAASALALLWAGIGETLEWLDAAPGATAFDNATPFLSAFGHAVLAWLWLDQAMTPVAESGDDMIVTGKRHAARFFFDHEVPRIAAWLAPVRDNSNAAAQAPTSIF